MITLDASIVIAHLSSRDIHHDAATRYLSETNDEFVMHGLNVAEVLVGAVRVGRGDEMLEDLRAIGIRIAESSEGEPLRLATLRVSTGLKLPDCCALDTALITGSALGTVDAALAKAARGQRVAVGPEINSGRHAQVGG